jgi:amidohydrolase
MTFTDQPLGANSMGFKVRFYGLSAHAASQQKGKDAILMAVEAITAMEFMAAKEVKVNDARLLNIGSIHGGKTNNVICDFVEIFGSCRAHTDAVSDFMERRIQEICQGVALVSGGRVEYERLKFLPYRVQSVILHEKARETALRVLGEENVIRPANRGLGGEDFGYLSRQKPCYFTFFGCKPGEESVPPVHNSKFYLPAESMIAPINYTIRFVLDNMHGIEGL